MHIFPKAHLYIYMIWDRYHKRATYQDGQGLSTLYLPGIASISNEQVDSQLALCGYVVYLLRVTTQIH
jgi:hypothetical protein